MHIHGIVFAVERKYEILEESEKRGNEVQNQLSYYPFPSNYSTNSIKCSNVVVLRPTLHSCDFHTPQLLAVVKLLKNK